MIYKAYRYRLYPTEEQKRVLAQYFGAVRFVYNWGLEKRQEEYKKGKRINLTSLQSVFANLKTTKEKWLKEIASQPLQTSLRDSYAALSKAIEGKSKFPAFKSKRAKQRICFPQLVTLDFDLKQITLPKIGPIKCVISQRFEGKLKTVTVSKTLTGKYFASCLVEVDINPANKPEPIESDAVGIDLGIKHFATLSTGEVIDNPRFLNKSLKAVRRAQRKHSNKKKGGKNREKSRIKLARLHEKVANQRLDFLHKVTTKLTRENQANTLCIEDLNVEGMGKNHKLARHIKDVAFGTFRKLLECKANWYGKNVLVIDRFAPSSKKCSCGVKNTELKLSQRTWTCVSCGTTHDRDLLAAQNIVRFAFHPELAS